VPAPHPDQRLQQLAAAHNRNRAEQAIESLRESLLQEQRESSQAELLADPDDILVTVDDHTGEATVHYQM
jgi:predicted transcriptional regulator